MKLVDKPTTSLNEEDTKKLLAEVIASAKADDRYFESLDRDRDLLKGIHWKDQEVKAKEAKIVVNMVYAHIRATLPTLFFREPYVECLPANPAQAGKEETWELLINNVLPRINYKGETKKAIHDAVVYKEGWKKITFSPSEDDDNDGGTGTLAESNRGPLDWLGKSMPISIRESPRNVIVDHIAPGRDPDKARFIAIRYLRPLSELRADPRYKNIPKQLNEQYIYRDNPSSPTQGERVNEADWYEPYRSSPRFATGTSDLVWIYEIWIHQMVDLRLYKQMCVLMEGVDKPIRDLTDWKEFVGVNFPGWPIHRIIFNPVPDDYPQSDAEVWIQLQQSLDWCVSKIINFVSNNNQIITVDRSKLTKPENFDKQFYNGKSREAVETNGPGAIEPIPLQGVSRDLYEVTQMLIGLIQQVSGIGENRRGASGIRTATEASVIEQSQQIKTNERVDIVSDFLKADIEKIICVIRNTIKTDEVVRLVGDSGKINWVTITADDIKHSPDINIRVNSFREANMQEEIAKWMQVLRVGLQLIQVLGPSIRIDLIYRHMLKALRVPNVEEIIGGLVNAREIQLIEIVAMLNGEQIEPQANEPHKEHINAIDMFMNGPVGQKALEQYPMLAATLLQHRSKHEAMLEQLIANSPASNGFSGQNPMDDVQVATPANNARRETAFAREATKTSFDGAAGQLAI